MLADEINRYLTFMAPAPYCDDCICAELYVSARSRTTLITNALATTRDFRRGIASCNCCGKNKKVTHAYRR